MKKTIKAICLALLFLGTTVGAIQVASAQYTDVQSFYRSTLTNSISSTATTINVSVAPHVSTGYLVIEPRTPNQEIVRMTSRVGTALTVVRGLSATSTSPVDAGYKRAHSAGSAVEMVDVHYYIRELQNFTGGLTVDSPTLVVDTTNHRIGMGTTTPASQLHVDAGNSTGRVIFDRDAGNPFIFSFRTDNKPRWAFRVDGTESGTNTGSDLAVRRYDDSGTFVSAPITITRSNGFVGISTSTPETALDVYGVSSFGGNLNVRNNRIINLGTPVDQTDAATKDYADNLAISGGVIASNIVTGIQRVASSTQIASGFSSSTAFAIPSSLASSTASSTTIVVATKSSTGKIDPSFLNGSTESYTFNGTTTLATTTINGTLSFSGFGLNGAFGDATDGNVTISAGTTTLSRDMYYDNLTVTGVLQTNGYKVYVANTISGTGVVTWGIPNNGSNGNVGSGGSGTGGSGASMTSGGFFGNVAGTNGGNGSTGSSCQNGTAQSALSNSIGAKGGVGGTGTCTGGTVGNTSYMQKPGILSWNTIAGIDLSSLGTTTAYQSGNGGSGGGGGNSNSSGFNNGGGGGGGASCGTIFIAAKTWGGSFTIRCIGGNGGQGADTNHSSNTGYAGGGGGGGAGGNSYVIYDQKTWSGSYQLTGGSGGLGGSTTGGSRASSGANGTVGNSYEFDIKRLLR